MNGRPTNIFAFSGLCLAVTFVWDVAYAAICDALGKEVAAHFFAGFALLALFLVPMLLCFGLGFVLGQWREPRPLWLRIGAAAWCMIAPFVMLIPFFSFMCFVLSSCFGD